MNLSKRLTNKHKFDVLATNNSGWTALHFCVRNGSYELLTYFADMGTDIQLKTNDGRNCLHIAALNGHLNLCKRLVDKHKFDVLGTSNIGWTALHFSARNGSYELLTYFADMGTDIQLKTNDGWNCLHIAALNGHLNLSKRLIDKHKFDGLVTCNSGWTALHFSAGNGSYELLTYFTDIGTDIQLKTNDGLNCLYLAALNGHLNLCKRLTDKHNFDVLATNNSGWTALHFSARNGSYELLTYFADMGTDIQLKTNDGWNCLHIAAVYGHLNLCKKLVDKHNFDVLVTCKSGWTALHFSARNGSYEPLTYFADMGTDIQLKTNDGWNCLHIAAVYGHLNLSKRLIDKHKFDVLVTCKSGWTALHLSARNGSYELLTFFVDIGTDIHLKTNKGQNCLHIAALYGHLNVCKILIDKHNFDVHMNDNDGWTALHFCAKNDSYELISYFAGVANDIYLKTSQGKNCLHIAALQGNTSLWKKLIGTYNFNVHVTDNDGRTPFHILAEQGNYELLTDFIGRGTDIHLKDNQGQNYLHIATLHGHFNFCKALIDEQKFDVHMTDNDGLTALHFAAKNGSYELLRYFVGIGIDIHLKTNDGRNCLHIAVLNGHLNLCKTLIDKHKFDIRVTDNEGWTALHFSAENGCYELFTYFADMGTDIINLKTNQGQNCLHIAALNGHINLCKTLIDKYKFDVHMADNEGWEALHFSAKNGNYQLLTYFVAMGTNVLLKTNDGRNCLHIAALHGDLNLCKKLIDKHKFDFRVTDDGGWTALHFSAANGSYELFLYLYGMGTDIHLKSNHGWNCLHIASLHGHLNLCKTLIDKHKFDLQVTDNDGWTALHFSAANGSYELLTYFVGIGTDIHLKTNDDLNCLHIAAFYGHLNLCKTLVDNHSFDVQLANKYEKTALHFSAESGSFDLFLYILEKGGEIYRKTASMENVLHLSARNGNFDICKFVLEHFTKDFNANNNKNQFVLSCKFYKSQVFYRYSTIFLHAMDDNGNTYLHLAAEGNKPKICELLLKYDTEIITLFNKKDKTAQNIAQDCGYRDVLNTLKAEYDRAGMFLYLNWIYNQFHNILRHFDVLPNFPFTSSEKVCDYYL